MEMTRVPFNLKMGGKNFPLVAPATSTKWGALVEVVGNVEVEGSWAWTRHGRVYGASHGVGHKYKNAEF